MINLRRSLIFCFLAAAGPAAAGDIQGDAYSCFDLWEMRNSIYKSGGYCFKQPKAIKHFGNAGCQHDEEGDVPISDNDRIVLKDIKASEQRQGCK